MTHSVRLSKSGGTQYFYLDVIANGTDWNIKLKKKYFQPTEVGM